MSEYDELMAIHSPLVESIQEVPHYRGGEVSAIHGYSEGVEHALDTAWVRGYRKVVSIEQSREAPYAPDALPPRRIDLTRDTYEDGMKAALNWILPILNNADDTAVLYIVHEPK